MRSLVCPPDNIIPREHFNLLCLSALLSSLYTKNLSHNLPSSCSCLLSLFMPKKRSLTSAMLDPLTAAAIVASLIALAGTTSKALDQFYRSIHDAPGIARDLLSGLYALNAALSQIQETRAIAEMTYHKVNNIQDICQSAVDFRNSCKPFAEPTVLGCTKRLPSDYAKKEMKTLQSYSPMFSLTLADLGDDSTGAFLERWLESSDPLPCIMCTL